MELAFALFRYFPHGGLQRDFMTIVQACLARGHRLRVYAMDWQGQVPEALALRLLPVRAWRNHQRCREFAGRLDEALEREPVEVLVGFNKMPGLDFYYAADTCYVERVRRRPALYRLGGRHRLYASFEKAVFGLRSATRILALEPSQTLLYQQHYQTPADRFASLPPFLDEDRRPPPPTEKIALRQDFRRRHGVAEQERLWLALGSGYRTKGLDRSIRALAGLPAAWRNKVWLFAVGRGSAGAYKLLARRLGVAHRLRIFSGRSDVLSFLLGADLLLHPARTENTGKVLLEAMAAGLPVVVSGVCGWSRLVAEAQAGVVMPEPFVQADFNRQAQEAMGSPRYPDWQRHGPRYCEEHGVFARMPAQVIASIEAFVHSRNAGRA